MLGCYQARAGLCTSIDAGVQCPRPVQKTAFHRALTSSSLLHPNPLLWCSLGLVGVTDVLFGTEHCTDNILSSLVSCPLQKELFSPQGWEKHSSMGINRILEDSLMSYPFNKTIVVCSLSGLWSLRLWTFDQVNSTVHALLTVEQASDSTRKWLAWLWPWP